MVTPEHFKQDVRDWADKLRVKVKEIHIRKMSRKLASCSTKGRLTFDTSLLNVTKTARAKAILHELLHLRYPNHGKMFKALLNAHIQKIT